MEKINKMERSKQEQNIIRIVKGSLFAIILTFIFLFIFATILTYSNIPESTITPIVIIITAISILIGSAKSTRKINKNGMINGGMVGYNIYNFFICFIKHSVFWTSAKPQVHNNDNFSNLSRDNRRNNRSKFHNRGQSLIVKKIF